MVYVQGGGQNAVCPEGQIVYPRAEWYMFRGQNLWKVKGRMVCPGG